MVRRSASESEERVAEEGADVIYHLAVLLLSRGISMAEVLTSSTAEDSSR